jgi:hypothetical protein
MQTYGRCGIIDECVLVDNESYYDDLIGLVKDKKWNAINEWCYGGTYEDDCFTKITKKLEPLIKASGKAQLVLFANESQYQSAFVPDKQLNLRAFITNIVANCEFE